MRSRTRAAHRTGRHRAPQRAAVIAIPIVAAVLAAGTALAYWTTTGSGTGTAQTAAGQAVTVTQIGTAPTGLTPGGSAQNVDFKITNPASTKQYIATVTMSVHDIRKISDNTVATGCTSGDFTLTQPNAINTDLNPGDTSFVANGATIAMKDTASNQDACKNVVVNLDFAAA